MKGSKQRMEFFSFYNHTGVEEHLTNMARKGWMIESITNVSWTYRKIEPKEIHFTASYYPRASDFDPEPTEEQKEFNDYCARTGWQYVCSWFQMQIFCNEADNPLPLDTDPIMEVCNIHRACKKNFLIGYWLLFALGFVASAYSLAGIYFVPIDRLAYTNKLVILLAWVSLFAMALVELVAYYVWLGKAKKGAQNGIFVTTPSTSKFQKGIIVFLLIVVVGWFRHLFAAGDSLMLTVAIVNFFIVFGTIFFVNFIKQGLKKVKASRGMNRFLTFAACFILPVIFTTALVFGGITAAGNGWFTNASAEQEEIQLSVSDFYEVDESKYVQQDRNNQTFIMSHRVVHMYGDWNIEDFHALPDLQYTITTIKVPFFYERAKAQMYRDLDETDDTDIPAGHRLVLKEQDPTPWGANEVYRLYQEEGWYMNWYLLCYEDRIVDIRFDWEPTTDDMAIVNQKLNP